MPKYDEKYVRVTPSNIPWVVEVTGMRQSEVVEALREADSAGVVCVLKTKETSESSFPNE